MMLVVTTAASAAASQALLRTAVDKGWETWRSGQIGDVLTLAINRAAGSAVAGALDRWREMDAQHSGTQQQTQTSGDPTADAEGVTDSQARLANTLL